MDVDIDISKLTDRHGALDSAAVNRAAACCRNPEWTRRKLENAWLETVSAEALVEGYAARPHPRRHAKGEVNLLCRLLARKTGLPRLTRGEADMLLTDVAEELAVRSGLRPCGYPTESEAGIRLRRAGLLREKAWALERRALLPPKAAARDRMERMGA